ncbi:AAA domain-containing protein [Clostridium akagii]|uniref:AAA domain-containing protein n=1 Tax=Clostridium akagii TaxID=91623 RepID=UPI00047A1300|nr:AAA domain-containing protein [Clostridium akagii]
MNCKSEVKNLLSYLLSIKNMDEETIRDMKEYTKIYLSSDLENKTEKYEIKCQGEESWYCIDKTNKDLYDEFFKLYNLIKNDSVNHEIVWANYILTWNNGDKKIIHPLITTKLELDFDAQKAVFLLKPYNCKMRMELDMLSGVDIENIDYILKIKETAENSNVNFRDINEVLDILNKIVHYLSSKVNPDGEIQNNINGLNQLKITQYPTIYNYPVIILRKNDHRLWHDELVNTIKLIDEGYPIPPSVQALVSNEIVEDENTKKDWASMSKEILFPLPSNEEQKEVARRLKDNFGLVVEGPPGTGKSQTIVNLICHLLANGKRVLITSQTGRALKVLSEKIPDEIKSLCISILGDDTKSLTNLDDSLRTITENMAMNPDILKRDIDGLQIKLNNCKNRQKQLCRKLAETEAIEGKKVNLNGNLIGLIDVAKWVRKNEEDLSWIEDNIRFDSTCPLTDKEFLSLINSLNGFNREEIMKGGRIKKVLSEIPDYVEIADTINEFLDMNKNHEKNMDNLKDWYVAPNSNMDYDELINILTIAEKQMGKIHGSWVSKVMRDYYNSEITRPVLKHLYMKCSMYIRDLSDMQRRLTIHSIKLPSDKPFNEFEKDFKSIYDHFKTGNKAWKFFKSTHKKYRYIFDNCLVDGKPMVQRAQIEIIKLYIEKKQLENQFILLWNTNMKEYETFEIEQFSINSMMVLEECINELAIVIDWNINVKSKILNILGDVAFLDKMDWYEEKTYTYLKNIAISLRNNNKFIKDRAYILNIKKLCHGLEDFRDIENAIDQMDLQSLKDAYEEVDKFKIMASNVDSIDLYFEKLQNMAPRFAKKLIESKDKNRYKEFNKAWDLARCKSLLQKANEISSKLIEKLLQEEKLKENALIEQFVSKSAWRNQIINVSDSQKKSLYAWLQATKKIGKGRSKFADKYRDIAQREMEDCKDSVPVWIMPLNKIVENIKVNSNPFDVIIFDESSQCDIFSICALFRAKRAVIVGDDKQISPQIVGTDQSIVNKLIDKYLRDIPHYQCFDLETSLYNTALRSFPSRLLLKEHFRCVPEIIGFSNNLCYSNEIIPLKYINTSNSLGMPIKVVKVINGEKDKIKNINVEEAKTLVNKVVECCKNIKYDGMTMGVISLLGDTQAEIIGNMVREQIGESEMLKRKLICGDAYSFQGDERDIIFLSMVVGDNVKFTALTRDVDIRRFNVAVSRAKNQIWLFSSINTESLNPDCVRTKLLRYFMDPKFHSIKEEQEIRVFESAFHKDVYKIIMKKGYKITMPEGLRHYNVDFVVQGNKNKIAIVCNCGTRIEKEKLYGTYEKRGLLESNGWVFFKINGSQFYMNPEKTMEKLWEKLECLGIERVIA